MNNNNVTGRIRWVDWDPPSTISKIERSQYEIKVKGGEEEKEEHREDAGDRKGREGSYYGGTRDSRRFHDGGSRIDRVTL